MQNGPDLAKRFHKELTDIQVNSLKRTNACFSIWLTTDNNYRTTFVVAKQQNEDVDTFILIISPSLPLPPLFLLPCLTQYGRKQSEWAPLVV